MLKQQLLIFQSVSASRYIISLDLVEKYARGKHFHPIFHEIIFKNNFGRYAIMNEFRLMNVYCQTTKSSNIHVSSK